MGNQVHAFNVEKSSSNHLWDILWENTSDFVIEVDQEGICLKLNKVFPDDNLEDMIGTNLFDEYLSTEQKQTWEKLKPTLFQKGSLEDIELTIDFGDTVFWQCRLFLTEPHNPSSTILIIATDATQPQVLQNSAVLSDKYHRNIFETIKDGIVVTDLLGKILEVNPAYCTLMGYKRDELIGRKANSLIHPEFTQDIKNMRNQFLATGQIAVESVQLHKDGKTKIPVEINSSIFTQHGRLSLLTVVRNITTRKEAELKLRYSEQRYRHLFNNSPDMVFTLDLATEKVMDCSQSLLDKLGYSKDEIIGKSQFDFFDEASIAEAQVHFSKWLENKQDYEAERIFVCKDKTKIPVWIKCSGMLNEMFNVLYIVARDNTERKEFETKLKQSESRYRDLYDTSPDMTVTSSVPDGIITNVNQTLLTVTGYAREELLGKPFTIIYTDESVKAASQIFSGFLNGKPVYEFERVLQTKSGELVPINIKATEVFNECGELIELRGVGRDISERKALEQQVENLRREHHLKLAHVTRVSAMGEMATGLAHELNQPLSAITNYLNGCIRRLKGDGNDVAALIKAMELAVTESQRAANIIQWLREFVKNKKHNPQYLNVLEEISEAIHFVQFRNKSISIEIDNVYINDFPEVYFDKIQLQQVLINVLNNAIDALMMSGVVDAGIKIKVDYHDGLSVSIADNGAGMLEKTAAKIFDPFFTTKSDGMGMGLAICRSIMEKNDGALDLQSTGPDGTTFILTMPRRAS